MNFEERNTFNNLKPTPLNFLYLLNVCSSAASKIKVKGSAKQFSNLNISQLLMLF